jgi:hypothetical protein
MAVKPILFNTEMVRAILEGRKSCTRRIVKPQQLIGMLPDKCKNVAPEEFLKEKKLMFKPYCDMTDIELINSAYIAPYQPGDILYVRETWEHFDCCCCEGDEHGNCYQEPQQNVLNKSYGCYMYRATDEIYGDARWHPSIHMPKEAARIWLKVTDVRVERLQSITEGGAIREGAEGEKCHHTNTGAFGCTDCMNTGWIEPPQVEFMQIWNNTIKKSDLDRYGWDANPWVWVIEFERCEKPEGV